MTNTMLERSLKDEQGEYWRLVSYCEYPTATMEKLGTQERIGGAVHSRNLHDFKIVDDGIQEVVDKIENQHKGSKGIDY